MMASTVRRGLMASLFLAGAPLPAVAEEEGRVGREVEGVEVQGERQNQAVNSPMRPQSLLDTPQTVQVLDDKVLEQQNVITLRDAMRNVSGVSIQAGEGNPPSGDAMKIRGFNARDDILLDGMPDVGNYLRDPFYAQAIEVTQGPSSAFGGRGNTGGTVNLVTRRPGNETIRLAEVSVGTASLYRFELDVNELVDERRGIAVRFNAMAHSADVPGRDVTHNDRWGVHGAVTFGLGGRTRTTLDYLHIQQNELPDMGIPTGRDVTLRGSGFEGQPLPVPTHNFYGYTTDYRDITADVATVRFEHDFSGGASLFSQFRYGRTDNFSEISSPRVVGSDANNNPADPPPTTITQATQADGFRKPRDEVDWIAINQTSLTVPFHTGGIAHTFVGGFELSRQNARNRRRLDARGPAFPLFAPVLQAAPPTAYNGTIAELRVDNAAVFGFDNIQLTRAWEVNLGFRYDDLRTHVRGIDTLGVVPSYNTDLTRTDRAFSGSASVVFHPTPNSSLYASYGTAFEPSGSFDVVQIAGANNNPPVTPANFFVDAERSRSVEFGYRLEWRQVHLNAAVFRTEKTNARTPGVNPNEPPVVLNGTQTVDGFTLGLNGEVREGWALFANYTYLNGRVTRSNRPFEVGQRLDFTPEHTVSLWTTWRLSPTLQIGGGAQYVSERVSNIRPDDNAPFATRVDGYVVVDAVAIWRVHDNAELRLNLYNLTDEDYFQSFQQSHAIPAPSRSAIVTLAVGF